MKKQWLIVVALALSAIVILISCSQESKVMQIEKQNKALVRYVHEEIAKGNVAVFDEVLSPDYVRHCQAMPPGLQELHGTDQFKAFIEDFWGSVSNYTDSVGPILAEGDKVAYISTMRATQTGPMGKLPASGKSFILVNIVIHRFEEGKIAETWVSWDNVAMLTQLGFFPTPPPDQP